MKRRESITHEELLAELGLTEEELAELRHKHDKYEELRTQMLLADERREEELERQNWLSARKEAAFRIDSATARVREAGAYFVDPNSGWKVRNGGVYFARSPAPYAIWVRFDDLPEATLKALQARIDANDPTVWDPEPDDEIPF